MEVAIIIVLLIALILIRVNLKESSEACGRNICPQCNKKMEMGVSGRYYCTHCGYRQGLGYF